MKTTTQTQEINTNAININSMHISGYIISRNMRKHTKGIWLHTTQTQEISTTQTQGIRLHKLSD